MIKTIKKKKKSLGLCETRFSLYLKGNFRPMAGHPVDGYFLQWIFLVLRDSYGHQNRWLQADFGEKTAKIESLEAQVEE